VGEVAYRLHLPAQLADVHDVFHISQLKRGLKPHDKEPLPIDGLDVKEDLTITEWPIKILDRLTRVTRNRTGLLLLSKLDLVSFSNLHLSHLS
jgi:hypothetical protein